MSGIFNASVFNNAAFNTVASQPASSTPQVLPISVGGAGWANPKLSSLTRTWNLPGVREILEKEDELIIETIAMAVINETIH